jgi:anti-sigma B factor antagonist
MHEAAGRRTTLPGVNMNGILVERAAPGVEIVTVTGEHDLSSAPELERILDEAFSAGGPVAVDLLGTTFIDSTVLRILICAREEAKHRGVGFRVALGETTGHGVRRLLELTGMEHRLATAPTRESAIAGAAGAGPS